MKIECCVTSSLQKNFGKIEELNKIKQNRLSVLKGERFSFQWALTVSEGAFNEAYIEIDSPLSDYIKVYTVENVPVNCTCYPDSDDDFISKEPGIFPDLLLPQQGTITLITEQIRSLWIELSVPENISSGVYKINLKATHIRFPEVFCEQTIEIEIIDAVLKKQDLMFTQWFHYDSLADYYGVEVFSNRHWEIIGNYLENTVHNGANMLLLPVFTPPLDTEIGNERTTVQLVDIEIRNGEYYFNFSNFEKLVALAKEKGIEYFEISHLFSQWGAAFTPKIEATENGEKKKIFFWTSVRDGESYKFFLSRFLPCLIKQLKKLCIFDKTFFHISDEPNNETAEIYGKSKAIAGEFLADCNIIDAVSEIELYENGLIENPVVSTDHIQNFIEKGYEIEWLYYCCGQQKNSSNRFISMPSYRNRIIGVQLFKYGIKGFLHWGYNFWYNYLSRKLINPFVTTDADGIFPGGDAFSVYPGADGKPLTTIRQMVFYEALQDIRAMEMLASYTSKGYVTKIIDEISGGEVTFASYPKTEDFILKLRNRINEEIKLKKVNKL